MKLCRKCNESKPLAAFYPDSSKTSGVSSFCRECQCARSKWRWETKREECRASNRAWCAANKDRTREHSRRNRREVLRQYGGRCACCGETTPEFLAIDHVNNDGEAHRREIGGYGGRIYEWLRRNGYPKDGRFQLLCHNCNMAKGLYGGCPHKGTPPGRRAQTKAWLDK